MNCFYHSQQAAVATCKHCHRALCHDCLTDLGDGIACKSRHEEQVRAVNNLIATNLKAHSTMPKTSLFFPIFMCALGLLFALQGWFGGYDEEIEYFPLISGILFLVFGIVSIFINWYVLRKR